MGSPIEENAVDKMSDQSWLRAFQKYGHGVEHHEFLKGGSSQLSSLLTDEIKNNPKRFSKLLLRVPADIDHNYAIAFIDGFAASPLTANECFTAIRHFRTNGECEIKRPIAWAIQKLLPFPIADDIFAILYSWATSEMGEDELWWSKGDNHGSVAENLLNSDSGAAFIAVTRTLDSRDTDEARATKWELIEQAVVDKSVVLKVGAIQALRYMIWQDRERAFDLFTQLLTDVDNMFKSQDVREFLWSSMFKNFKRAEPYIRQMMFHADENVQQRGAELACIASFSNEAMEDEQSAKAATSLERTVMEGNAVWKCGAARIYTHNMRDATESELRQHCMEKVIGLLDDTDEKVTRHIDSIFFNMSEKHSYEIRPFMEAYAKSNCKKENGYFSKYLWEHGGLDPSWSLKIVRAVLATEPLPNTYWSGAEELMRLTLRIYNSPLVSDQTKREALDTFDTLMENYSGKANALLEEWDRR